MKTLAAVLSILLLLILCPPAAAQWEIAVSDQAAPVIRRNHAPVVTAGYNFWAADWKYAGARWTLGGGGSGGTTFSGSVGKLGLKIDGRVGAVAANQLRWTWDVRAAGDLEGIIGGGLEFQLELESPTLEGRAGEPALLADNLGWRWPVAPGREIVVRFDRPVAAVYFERGQKNRVRTHFLGSSLAKGRHRFAMTVTLPQGGRQVESPAERYGPLDTSSWYAGALPYDASPVDLSFLNHKPAGRHGFVTARGDELVFADGTPARFWGGNLAAYAIFSDKAQIEVQARRIARLGYNLMRIHHHDSTAWVRRTVIDKGRDDSQHLDPEVMDRLDYWIKCLKDQGVYVWLDLHVGRQFKAGDEIGPGFAEMDRRGKGAAEAKGFCYFNQRIEELMREFNQKYLDHVNRYTELAYKDDPAVMGILLTNENDLTCHFGNLMLADKHNPWHHRVFEAAVKAFAGRHGLLPGPTGQTWLPGPSKLFLADWEHAWNRRMLKHLDTLGVRVPVATTQMWGGMNLCGLPPLTAGGIIDVHSYGRAEALGTNPRYEPNYIAYLASGQAYGKPVSITEWNVPYPAADRFTAPLYVASLAALQGWDAPMIYNYSQREFSPPARPGTWSTFTDPALTGLMPAAALLYRQGHVAPARRHYCLMLDRKSLYYRSGHPRTMATLRTLVEQSKLSIGLPDVEELDWDRQTTVDDGTTVVTDPDRDFIPPGQNFVRSDTGQLTRDWVRGVQAIDTERTQAVQGWIGGQAVQLSRVGFQIETPKAAVAVSSLDDRPLGQSARVLVTAIARAVASEGNRMPFLSEPVRGALAVAGPPGLRLVPLGGDGRKLPPVDASYQGGQYTVRLPAVRGTHWFLLTTDH